MANVGEQSAVYKIDEFSAGVQGQQFGRARQVYVRFSLRLAIRAPGVPSLPRGIPPRDSDQSIAADSALKASLGKYPVLGSRQISAGCVLWSVPCVRAYQADANRQQGTRVG